MFASSSSSPSSSSEKSFTLKSSDNKEFILKESIAIQFETIKRIIEEEESTITTIPLPNVDSETLTMAIDYCSKHADSKISEEADLKKFDSEFVATKDLAVLFKLVSAANYLDVKGLLELICQRIADQIKDLMPEEVRKIFNIENDFTPEEEAVVRNEHEWAFNV
ncbi:SKP1-like protein 4 [Camellia lanceoleosa]|uniref:SKP1-like protein 4 n=1 Tax=Camellia lanceoleosa TaxID=1840588 RepID=A0ACC0F4J3_9ERIC|nr:SKP1-like protein 4 [Camellia lanceoleosa]